MAWLSVGLMLAAVIAPFIIATIVAEAFGLDRSVGLWFVGAAVLAYLIWVWTTGRVITMDAIRRFIPHRLR